MPEPCKVCSHMESAILDRMLVLPDGTPGKRGPRSLAPVFGLHRRDIARHEKQCLTGERRERALARNMNRVGRGEGNSYG